MVTVNSYKQSFTYILGISLPSLLFECCRDLTDVITAQLIQYKILQLSESAYHVLHNCVTSFAIIAVTSSCHDITCESIPGFLFLIGARREPRNKVRRNEQLTINKMCLTVVRSTQCVLHLEHIARKTTFKSGYMHFK